MQKNNNINDVILEYDYDSLKRRLVDYGVKRDYQEQTRLTNDYISRRVRIFRIKLARAPKKSVANMFKYTFSFAKSDGARIALAGIIVLPLIFAIGNALYSQYDEQRESAFGQKCSEKNFTHLSNNICYDEYRHIQTLNSDGAAKRGAMDWNVQRETGFADRVANPK